MPNEFEDFYSFEIEDVPGLSSASYVARITGEHPQYVYNRSFLPLKHTRAGDKHRYSCDVEANGVYERSTKYFRLDDGRYAGREREYFIMFDGEYYELEPGEVLFALFNMKLQLG